MIKLISIFSLSLSILSAPAFAGTTTCVDLSGQFRYEAYHQEGGPCCGRSTSTLSVFGKILKQTQDVEAFGGEPTVHEDSNPHLKIVESHVVDMNNSTQVGNIKTVRFAENMKLSRDDGPLLIPGMNGLVGTVSLICSQSNSIVPNP